MPVGQLEPEDFFAADELEDFFAGVDFLAPEEELFFAVDVLAVDFFAGADLFAVDVEVLEVPEDFLPDFRPPDIALPARERAVPAAEVTVPAAARAAAGAAFGSDFGSAT